MNNLLISVTPLSQRAAAGVLSISAVFFDPLTSKLGDEFFIKIDVNSCRLAGLDVSSDSLRYWLRKQSSGVDLFSDDNKLSLRLALHALSGFIFMDSQTMSIVRQPNSLILWGDRLDTLSNCYDVMGINSQWERSNFRSFQTMASVGLVLKHRWKGDSSNHPLELARDRAIYLCQLWPVISKKNNLFRIK